MALFTINKHFFKKPFKKRVITKFGIIAVLGLSLLLQIFAPINVSADISNPEDEVKSAGYYSSLRMCVKYNMYGTISGTAATKNTPPSKWFDDNDAWGLVWPGTKKDCKDIMVEALKFWGWGTNYSTFLTKIGYTYNTSDATWKNDADGEGRSSSFVMAVQGKYYTMNFAGDPTLSPAAKYFAYLTVFGNKCYATDLGKFSSITNSSYKDWLNKSTKEIGYEVSSSIAGISSIPDNKFAYFSKIKTVDEDSSGLPVVIEHGYAYTGADGAIKEDGVDSGKPILYGYHMGGTSWNRVQMTCHQLQKGITDNASAWLAYKEVNPDTELSPEDAIEQPTIPGTIEDSASACTVEAIGWIVCPVVNFLSKTADASFDFLSNNFLRTDPKAFDTSGPAYQSWSVIRGIANVVFVIVFLIIIFSQLTGLGISNYGVKKMLPRIVIAAILVNMSYFITQIAIDLSNILGYSIRDIFYTIATDDGMKTANGVAASSFATGDGFAGAAGSILALTAAGAALYLMLSALIPIVLAAVVALIMILFILVARQAIIVLLVVISPLAFVAFLLPNTENLFKAWRKMLTAMLLVFPIIALVFGVSSLASVILNDSFTSNVDGVDSNVFGQLIAAAVAVLPLFVVPILLKKSLDGIPVLGQLANKWSSRANANIGKKASQSYQGSRFAAGRRFREQRRSTNRTLAMGGEYTGKNPLLKASSAISGGLNKSRLSGQFGDRLAAQGIALSNKEESEAVSAIEQQVRQQSVKDPGAADALLRTALKKGDTAGVKAAQNVLFSQGGGGVGRFYSAVKAAESAGEASAEGLNAARENITTNHGQYIKSKAMDLVKWAAMGGAVGSASNASGFSTISQSDLASQTADTIRRVKDSIKPETAAGLLGNDQLNGNLDADQRAVLAEISGGKSSQGQAAPQPTTETSQAAPQSAPTANDGTATQPIRSTEAPTNVVPSSEGVFRVGRDGEINGPPK